MASSTLLRRILLLSLAVLSAVAASGAGQLIRVNCGASAPANDSTGLAWASDAVSKSTPSVAAVAAHQDPSLPSAVPYMTARVFASTYTYTFPVVGRRVFLRLFFYPCGYGGRSAADALFGVAAGGVTLLRDFNASQTALALGSAAYLVREFSLNVSFGSGAGSLDVTFTPSQPRYYGFVNGIEVVPAPDDLFGKPVPTLVRPDTAFQTMYRLNVGGSAVSPIDDSGHLYRSWDDDSPYILGAAFGVSYGKDLNVTIQYSLVTPSYAAPEIVYGTARSMGPTAKVNLNYNLTWVLPVDAGFSYLVRLHLCEIQYPITNLNQRVFDVYVNNRTAQEGVDVIMMSGGIGRSVHADYLVVAAPGQTDLWVELHPDEAAKPQYYDAILNGLEVFKLQKYDEDGLAGPNPPIISQPQQSDTTGNGFRPKKKTGAFVAAGAGGLAAVLMGSLCAWAVYKHERKAASGVADRAVSETPDSPSVILDTTKSAYVFDTAR
jgi:hypothetical protein